jgi:Fe-Mn family superoxide dismutase
MSTGQHTLPDLPYAYDGLEPYISRQIMELHHKKHHQTYVNSLNAAEKAYAQASTPKERIALQAALKFNGGGAYDDVLTQLILLSDVTCVISYRIHAGHINHSLFWKNLAPPSKESKGHGGELKDSSLKVAIVDRWGSYDNFVKDFNTTTAGIQGSGWGWLVRPNACGTFRV